MIYTVTFNPSLDYIVSVENFQLGLTNRTSSEMLLPGGKGINVSTVLMNLGIESTALGFTAGFTGDEIIRRLEEMGVRNGFIQVGEGFSRINLKLKSIDGTEINGQGPKIGTDKVDLLIYSFNLFSGSKILRKRTGTSSCDSHVERIFIILLLHISCHKSGNHGVSGSNTIDQLAFRCRLLINVSILSNKDRALSCHGNQYIHSSHLLEFLTIWDHGLAVFQFYAENLTKFMVIWLNKKWMIGENLHQKISRRVHCDSYASAVQHSHDLLVGIIRHG